MSARIRPAAVAGTFYPIERDALNARVNAYLLPENVHQVPKALIAPHAGYVYSGPVAGRVYSLLRSASATIRRVVLLGPSHRVPVHGLALPESDAFATPLGCVPLDRAAIESITDLAQVGFSEAAHALEHSVEVQLPFLQAILQDFAIVPLVVGHARAESVAEVIERLWGGHGTLIVISSDLSHYLPYASAREIDTATVRRILAGAPDISHDEACGATPVNGLLLAARRRGLEPVLVDLRNSGDTSGDRSRVVGYAAIAFMAGDHD